MNPGRAPKKLLLIDGIGALISAVFLGFVLVRFETHFGIPTSALYFLAVFPLLFAFYDFYCYFRVHRNLARLLKFIAVANLLYCCLSVVVLLFHTDRIQLLGWLYLIAEVSIVLILALLELRVAGSLEKL